MSKSNLMWLSLLPIGPCCLCTCATHMNPWCIWNVWNVGIFSIYSINGSCQCTIESRGIDRYPPTSESAESKDKIVVATNILLVYSRVVDQGKRTCSRFQHKTNTYCGWLRNPAPPKGWLNPKQNSGMNHLLTGEDRISLAHQQYLSTVPLVTVTNCRPKRIHHHIHGCPPDRVDRFLHIPEPHTSLTMSYPSPQE